MPCGSPGSRDSLIITREKPRPAAWGTRALAGTNDELIGLGPKSGPAGRNSGWRSRCGGDKV